LAAAFHRQIIAEGMESVEHGELLLQLGCELAQGYGIARPMPAAELPAWSTAWRPVPSWINQSAVNRDDLPLLFASVEHRSWIANLENCLRGESETPPALDHHHCHFGKWLYADGIVRYSKYPAFQPIEILHQQVHALAVELLKFQAQDRNKEALARLSELHSLRDALLKHLKALMQEIR
jgi:hypothetical protein